MQKIHLFLITVFIIFYSCNNKKNIDYELSDINIKRFEKDLFNVSFDTIKKHADFLQKKYGNFFEAYNHRVLKIGSPKNPGYPTYLQDYLTHFITQKSYSAVEKNIPI